MKILKGFKNFISRGSSVDLAVGVVIGASFNSVIQAIVKGFITPLIGVIVKTSDLSGLAFSVNGSKFMYGDIISSVISFFMVAAVIYFFVILPTNTVMSKVRKPKEPTTKTCPECLSEIPLQARRCAHCGQHISNPK